MTDSTIDPAGDPAGATPSVSDMAVQRGGSHPVRIGQLVMGCVFACAVIAWALIINDTVDSDDIRWLLPVPWLLGGAIGLLAMAVSGRRRRPSN